MTSLYWHEFFQVAILHLLAVMSPGPDFAVVVRESVINGRKTGIYTAIGVGSAILIHVSYSLFGIGILIKSTPELFEILKYIAAAYILYLGIKSIQSKKKSINKFENKINDPSLVNINQRTFFKSYRIGFLTNGLNPKATLFFVTIFATIISPNTPISILIGYGVYMAIVTGLWFILVASLFSHKKVRIKFEEMGYWFDRIIGTILILLAIKIATASLS